jgi:hypothetical protein
VFANEASMSFAAMNSRPTMKKKKKKIRDLELDLGKKSLELKVDTFWHMK